MHSNAIAMPMQMKPLGSHNSSFAIKRGVQAPVKSNPMEAVELNDLVNLEVSDGSDEGQFLCSPSTALLYRPPDSTCRLLDNVNLHNARHIVHSFCPVKVYK